LAVENAGTITLRSFLCSWPSVDKIPLPNVREFILYAFLQRAPTEDKQEMNFHLTASGGSS
jgi:hypothetical protein